MFFLLQLPLQSCTFSEKNASMTSPMVLTKTKYSEAQATRTEIATHYNNTPHAYLSSKLTYAALSAKVFTLATGHQVSFIAKHELWEAKVIDPLVGVASSTMLPVFCEQGGDILLMLQRLSRQVVSAYKHRIHLLHRPLGKCIFLGRLGLQGGMQEDEAAVALYELIEGNEIELIKQLLMDGADPDAPAPDGTTPLILAIMEKHIAIVTLLLDAGADPNKATPENHTPLALATDLGEVAIVEKLLAKGADPNKESHGGYTALHLAVGKVNRRLVELLLQNQAQPNKVEEDNCTALHLAVGKGNLEIMQLLLEHNADPNLANKDGDTPLHLAAQDGNLALVQVLIQNGADPNQANTCSGVTALHCAACSPSPEVVELLLTNEAEINQVDHDGAAPLHYAAAHGHAGVIRLLIAYKAQLNAVEKKNGFTPLNVAIDEQHLAATYYLLEAGADPNSLAQGKASALHYAAYYGNLAIMNLLLDKGADLNKADQDDNLPLHWAAMNGKMQAIKLLLQFGSQGARVDPRLAININAPNNKGNTFLHLVINNPAINSEAKFHLLQDILKIKAINCKLLLNDLQKLDGILERNGLSQVNSKVVKDYFTKAALYQKLAECYTKVGESTNQVIQEPPLKKARRQ